MVKYSILLVVHKHPDLTRACLEAVYRHSRTPDFELLILDNASNDGTADLLRAEAKRRGNISLFFNGENEGFMRPMNFLASKAKGEFFVVLNNDVQVCPNWLDEMRNVFRQNELIALVGISSNCGELGPRGEGLPVRRRLEYVEASCMMIPKAIYDHFGLFDADYYHFGYCEDSDLSLRLRERGFRIATIQLPVIHRRGSTMNRLHIDIRAIRERNADLFRKRWADYLIRRTFKKRVLFRRSGALGDVILATPIFQAYKERFPLSEIIVATRYPEALAGNPFVAQTVGAKEMPPHDEFIDLDLAYESRPEMEVIRAYAEKAGVHVNGHRPKIYAARQNGKAGKLAVFHAERIPNWPGRNAPIAAFRSAASALRRCGFNIVEVGRSASLPGLAEYRPTNFPQLCELIASASIFVGHDSAPFHVAQAFDVPAVVPFGAVDPDLRRHSDFVFPVLIEDVACLGCHHIAPPPQIMQRCYKGRPECMERLTGELFRQQIDRALRVKT